MSHFYMDIYLRPWVPSRDISKVKYDLEGPYFKNDFEERNIAIIDIDIYLGVRIHYDCFQLRNWVRQIDHR